ncbi:MAG: hypothetical protein H0V54_03765, partial [Chthoniobacterales bacterium]|nr:hypothetical protein [Chthoniobacterales bacterium]
RGPRSRIAHDASQTGNFTTGNLRLRISQFLETRIVPERIEHWDYKLEAWESFRNAQPNDVHRAIVRLEEAGKVEMVVTQNIDGLHSLAGTSAARLVELHGTNSLIECQSCRRRSDPEPQFEFFRAKLTPPLCECGGFLKPATISFGQSLEPDELERARHGARES